MDYTAEIKFLGIQITDTLKWHSRVQLLVGKLCKKAFMIKSLKEVLSPNLIQNIYFTKFHSLLWFGILFWGGTGGELTTRIFVFVFVYFHSINPYKAITTKGYRTCRKTKIKT